MAKTRRMDSVKLVGLARRKRAALLMSTALQATAIVVITLPGMNRPAFAQLAPNTAPTGGTPVAGALSISQTPAQTTINQSSQRGAISWQTYNVGSAHTVQYNQPSTTSVTLNRINDPNPSQIAGHINANGRIVLMNQAGVVFYQGAQVNTGGLMVTAASMSDGAMKSFVGGGPMVFDQAAHPNARVVNQGTITVADTGLAALVAPQVANAGTITARLGTVALAGATKATLDMYGDGLVSIDVTGQVTQAPIGPDGKPVTALVTNTGVIRADGGVVQLTARAADGVVTTLVDAGGTIRANTLGGKTGAIALNGVGGDIVVHGQLSAVGSAPGSMGGNIEVNTTGNVTVASGASIDASGQAGGGTVAIGTTLARAQGGPGVTPTLTAHNVTVQKNAVIRADATNKGNGGKVTVLSRGTTVMNGTISAVGGPAGGDGGFVETSGYDLAVGDGASIDVGALNAAGRAGTWLLDPFNIDITNTDANTSLTSGTISASAVSAKVSATTVQNALATGDVVVDTTGAGADQGNITVSVALTWATAQKLTLHADNSIDVNAPITGTNSGSSLVLSAGNTTNTGTITVGDLVSVGTFTATAGTSGSINLNHAGGDIVTTAGGGQTYNSAVSLVANTSLVDSANGAIKFVSTVDSATSSKTLTVAAGTGKVTFGGAVGGGTSLASLTVTGLTHLGGNITTTGTQQFNSAVTLDATSKLSTSNKAVSFASTIDAATGAEGLTIAAGSGKVSFGGAVGGGTSLANLTVTGPTHLGGDISTSGTQQFNSAVTLDATAQLATTNSAVTFASTVDSTTGAEALTVAAGTGTVKFGDKVGSNKSLASLTSTGPTQINGDITTSGAQTYNSAVALGTSAQLATTNSAVTFASTVDSTTAAEALTVAAGTGTVKFGDKVGSNKSLASLTVTGPTQINGDITTSGTQAYNSAVTLGTTSQLATTNNAVTFASTVDSTTGAEALTVAAGTGTVKFGDKVGGNKSLASLTTTGPTQINGDITTSGTQQYNSALTLDTTAHLTTTNSAMTFASTVDSATGAEALTVNAGTGTVKFGDKVGSNKSLASLTVTGPTQINADITTSGAQQYNSAVALGGTARLATTNNAVTFASTVDSTTGAEGLTVAAGTATVKFGDKVGGNKSLASLTVTGPTQLNGDITTSGTQAYNSAVTLGATSQLATTDSAVTFASTVDSTTGAEALTVAAGTGTVKFGDKVGGNKSLASLAVTGSTQINGNITTSGTQTYNSALTLGTTAQLATTNSAVTFASTVDSTTGAEALTIAAGTGTVKFGDKVGSNKSLASLTVSGPTQINANITTSGAQQYNSAVALGAAAQLATANNAVNFASTIDGSTPGAQALTVSAGTATVTFGGAVGGATTLSNLSATGGALSLGGNIAATGTVALNSTGAGALTSAFNVSANTIKLNSGGAINQTGGTIAGSTIGLTASSSIALGGTVQATPSGTISARSNLLSITGAVLGGTFEYSLNAPGALVLGTGGNLVSLAGITTSLVRIGQVTGTTTANSISLGSDFDANSNALQLVSGGAVNGSGNSLTNVATLSVNAGGTVDLTGPANTITNLGDVTATTFASSDSTGLTVSGNVAPSTSATINDTGILALTTGTISAPNIVLSATNALNVNGTISAGTTGSLTSGAGGITLGTGAVVTGPTLALNGAGGGIALSGNAKLGNGGIVDLTTSAGGGVTEAATAVINASTLLSSGGLAGPVTLLGANVVSNIGSIANTGSYQMFDGGLGGTLTVAGPLTGTEITLAGSPALDVTGSIVGTGSVALSSVQIDIATTGSVSSPVIKFNAGSGGIGLHGNAAIGQSGGVVNLISAGTVSEAATSVITAATLLSSAGVSGNVSLLGTANSVDSLGDFPLGSSVTEFDLVDSKALGVTGTVNLSAASSHLYLESTANGGINVTGSVGATLVSLQADTLTNTGTISGTKLEWAPATTLAAQTLLSLGVVPTNLVIGAITQPGAGAPVIFAGSIVIGANFGSGTTNLDLESQGGISESGAFAITAASLTGHAGGDVLLGNANAVGTLGAFTVGGVSTFRFNDGGSLTIDGLVSSATVDLSGVAGISETGAGAINSTILQSSGGVTGNVALGGVNNVATLGGFAVSSGDFTLADSGSSSGLIVAGSLSATNVTINNTPTIKVTGGITAGSTLALAAGAGGIGLGADVGASVLDLSTTGGVTQTAGVITAATLQSASGVTGTVSLTDANKIGSVAGFAVTGAGNSFSLTEALNQNLAVSGPLTAAQDITLTLSGSGGITTTGSIGAGRSLVAVAGTGGIGLGADVGASVLDLSTTGGVTQTAGVITAATLQSASGVTGTVSLTDANKIGAVAGFAVTGAGNSFSLTEALNQNLSVTGPLTAAQDITLTLSGSGGITTTGSIGAGRSLVAVAGTGGIGLGADVGASVLDLSTTGGVTQSAGVITAATLQSSSGVTATVSLTDANKIGSVAGFAVTGAGNSFSLTEAQNQNLAVSGPLTAAQDITLNLSGSGGITTTGSIGAGRSLVAVAGTGGIGLGADVGAGVLDLSTTGGVTQTAGVITAATLQSASGVTGTVSLTDANKIGSVAGFAVTGAGNSFSLTEALNQNLAVSGPLTAAQDITLTLRGTGGITTTGSIGAGRSLVAVAGTGGIGLGADVGASVLDLSTTGGVTQTAGVITAATLQSAGGVTGAVSLTDANKIGAVAGFAVTGAGNSFSLTEALNQNLAVSGPLTAAQDITLTLSGSGGITTTGSIGAGRSLVAVAGTGGIGLGADVGASVLDLSTTGGVTQTAGVITAATLQSAGGVTGAVSLTDANKIGSVAGFAVTGAGNSFSLTEALNQNLAVSGPLTAAQDITLTLSGTGGITTTGSIGAGRSLVAIAGTGGIGLSADVGASVLDLSTTGGVTQTAGVITAATLQSAGGVTGTVSLTDANKIGSVAGFAVTGAGNSFSLTEALNQNLAVSGPLTAAQDITLTLSGSGGITTTGSIGAGRSLTATSGSGGIALASGALLTGPTIKLNGGSGNIALSGNAVLGQAGSVVDLTTTGAVTESGTSTIIAAKLQSTGNVVGPVSLSNANAVDSVGAFAVTGAGNSFSLTEASNQNLSVTGPLTAAQDVILALSGTGKITSTGSIGAGRSLTATSGSGGIALNAGALLTAPTVTLNGKAGGIALSGNAVLGQAGALVDLTATGGGVTESGTSKIIAATLRSTGNVVGQVSLTDANAIDGIAGFAVTGAGNNFSLTEASNQNLAVTGPLTAAQDVALLLSGTGKITATGSIAAGRSLTATSGTGGIALNNGAVLTGSTLKLNGSTGGIALSGNAVLGQTGALVDLTTTGGGVSETGSSRIIAATLQSSGNVVGPVSLTDGNNIANLAAFAVTGAGNSLSLTEATNQNLAVSGPVSATQDVILSLGGTGTLTATGSIAAGRSLVATAGSGGIALNNGARVAAPNLALSSVGGGLTMTGDAVLGQSGAKLLLTTDGGINEASTSQILAGVLSGNAGAGVHLAGTGNLIASIGSFSAASSTFQLVDASDLLLAGSLNAPLIVINDSGHNFTFGDGAVITTSGRIRPPGTIAPSLLPTASTDNGAYITAANFTQQGDSSVSGNPSIMRIDVLGGGNITFNPTGSLNAPDTWLILSVQDAGHISGAIHVHDLDVIFSGVGGSADLTGSVRTFSGQAAAGVANIEPGTNSSFHLNACPIHSINCVLLPTQGLPQANPLDEIFIGSFFAPSDEGDLLLPIVSDQDY